MGIDGRIVGTGVVLNLGFAHFGRVLFVMKKDETANPVAI
jgi:hypothetical protein